MVRSNHLVKILLGLVVITVYVLFIYVINVANLLGRLKSTVVDDKDIVNDKLRITLVKENAQSVTENSVIIQNNSMKYLLMWTHNFTYPFIYMKSGQQVFIEEKCEYNNCYVSNDRNYFAEITKWDAILFHAPEFTWSGRVWDHGLPNKRSPNQKYVFTCIESSENYPSCHPMFNNYFNWTWTYKVSSDVRWGYMAIRDKKTGQIIGPKADMAWEENMSDIPEYLKYKLKTKTKAAAWFVSNCFTKSSREEFARKLQSSLEKYNLKIDIYGSCGDLTCERDSDECWKMIERDYYFYLSFENSFAKDYVTEKFLYAMKYMAVPITWGGADYNRFAPPGSYIDGRAINDADKIAEQMNNSINNFDEYIKYFRWTNYYTYQRDIETPDTQAFCLMCKALNDPVMMSTTRTYPNFNKWWNDDDRC